MDPQYLFAIHKKILVLKLCGHMTYLHSIDFDNFSRQIFHKPGFHSVLIDLTETTGIDSTNLGIIARIGDTTRTLWDRKTTILSTAPDITRTIESMGFEQIFLLIDRTEEGHPKFHPIPTVADHDQTTLARTILEAHRELMAINKQNRETFSNVVAFMEKDILKLKKKDG